MGLATLFTMHMRHPILPAQPPTLSWEPLYSALAGRAALGIIFTPAAAQPPYPHYLMLRSSLTSTLRLERHT